MYLNVYTVYMYVLTHTYLLSLTLLLSYSLTPPLTIYFFFLISRTSPSL